MTAMARLPWLTYRRREEPSPVARAAAETDRITAELARAVEQLRRTNDHRERHPRQ